MADTNAHETGPIARRKRAKAAWRILWVTSLGLFTWLALLAHYQPYFRWDLAIAGWLQRIDLPGMRMLMVLISDLGNGWIAVAVVAVASLALLAFGLRKESLLCVTGAVLGSLLDRLLKAVIARPRPPAGLVNVALTYEHESFPSGHTVFFVVVFGFLIMVTWLTAKRSPVRIGLLGVFASLIALVGVSRVQLGAHWPSDVTGGYLLGGMILSVMGIVHARVSRRSAQETSVVPAERTPPT